MSSFKKPVVRFTPYAWSKLLFMCHTVPTEIGGMGITHKDDPLLVVDVKIIKQTCTTAHMKFDMDHYSEVMMDLCDPNGQHKLQPKNCQRIWIHTHPSGIDAPSGVDEDTFAESYGGADWAVMFILTRSGVVYSRLRMTASGVTVNVPTDVSVTHSVEFPAADHATWKKEIEELVKPETYQYAPTPTMTPSALVKINTTPPQAVSTNTGGGSTTPTTPTTYNRYGRNYDDFDPNEEYMGRRGKHSKKTKDPWDTPPELYYYKPHPALTHKLSCTLLYQLAFSPLMRRRATNKEVLSKLGDHRIKIVSADDRDVLWFSVPGFKVPFNSKQLGCMFPELILKGETVPPAIATELNKFECDISGSVAWRKTSTSIFEDGTYSKQQYLWLAQSGAVMILGSKEMDVVSSIVSGKMSYSEAVGGKVKLGLSGKYKFKDPEPTDNALLFRADQYEPEKLIKMTDVADATAGDVEKINEEADAAAAMAQVVHLYQQMTMVFNAEVGKWILAKVGTEESMKALEGMESVAVREGWWNEFKVLEGLAIAKKTEQPGSWKLLDFEKDVRPYIPWEQYNIPESGLIVVTSDENVSTTDDTKTIPLKETSSV